MIKRKKLKNPRDEELLKNIKIQEEEDSKYIQYWIYLYNKRIGQALYSKKYKEICWVMIEQPYKRRGLATYLYDFIENKLSIKLRPSDELEPEGKLFWQNRLKQRKNPLSNLEQFRLNSIAEIKKDADYLGDTVAENINSSRFEIYIVGSVLDSKKFNENSDIDLAIVIYDKRSANGWNEKLTDEFRDIFRKIPFDFGFLDVSVHNNELLPKQKSLKIYENI